MRRESSLTDLPAVNMARHISRLRIILARHGVTPGPHFEKAASIIAEMEKAEAGLHRGRDDYDNREDIRNAFSLAWFAEKIVDAYNQTDEFSSIVPHIRLLTQTGNFAHCTKSVPSAPADQTIADKLFELQVALGLFPWALQMKMDDPVTSSGGANPDVLFEFEGRLWGLACKSVHSKNPQQFRASVLMAIEQIDKSKASKGIVFISAKEIIDHDYFFQMKNDKKTDVLTATVWDSTTILGAELTNHVIDKFKLSEYTLQHGTIKNACIDALTSIVIVCASVALARVGSETKLVLANQLVQGDMRIPDIDCQKIIGIYGKFSNAVMIA